MNRRSFFATLAAAALGAATKIYQPALQAILTLPEPELTASALYYSCGRDGGYMDLVTLDDIVGHIPYTADHDKPLFSYLEKLPPIKSHTTHISPTCSVTLIEPG